MSIKNISWPELAQANLNELLDMQRFLYTRVDSADHGPMSFYCRLMIAYFRQDTEQLLKLSSEKIERKDLSMLAEIRLRICTKPCLESLQKCESRIFEVSDCKDLMTGEIYYALAMESQTLGDYKLSEELFLKSSAFFEKAEVLKKSLRASLSSLAAYSCYKPEARLFSEYHEVYTKALEVDDFQSACVSLINISREFQILNVLSVALDYANQAASLCEAHHHGTREHGLGLVHRAHILFQLDRSLEAERDCYIAHMMTHSEVQSAVRILADQHAIDMNTLKSEQLLPTWKERNEKKSSGVALGKLESQLIQLLSERSRDKFDLISNLYDDRLEFESREARFKNLLSRVRKRFPSLIILEKDRYKIVDPHSLNVLYNKKGQSG